MSHSPSYRDYLIPRPKSYAGQRFFGYLFTQIGFSPSFSEHLVGAWEAIGSSVFARGVRTSDSLLNGMAEGYSTVATYSDGGDPNGYGWARISHHLKTTPNSILLDNALTNIKEHMRGMLSLDTDSLLVVVAHVYLIDHFSRLGESSATQESRSENIDAWFDGEGQKPSSGPFAVNKYRNQSLKFRFEQHSAPFATFPSHSAKKVGRQSRRKSPLHSEHYFDRDAADRAVDRADLGDWSRAGNIA